VARYERRAAPAAKRIATTDPNGKEQRFIDALSLLKI